MSQTDGTDSRYMVRPIPETELLPVIIEEANSTDQRIISLENLMLGDSSLDAAQIACVSLSVGRCGWRRSESALRQVSRKLAKDGFDLEAQTVRLAISLLDIEPNALALQKGDEGYRFIENDYPELFVEDAVAGHWHRRGRWGPPIRPYLRDPVRNLLAFDSVSQAIEAGMNGSRVLIETSSENWFVTRAGFSNSDGLDSLIRWSWVRSMGVKTGWRKAPKLAFELEDRPIQVMNVAPENYDAAEEFLREMYRRTR